MEKKKKMNDHGDVSKKRTKMTPSLYILRMAHPPTKIK